MENNKTHILIVDDDDRIRSLLKEYLIENSYLVSTSENAENAKKKLTVFKFDLIVLDVMMPGKSGLDFIKENKNIIDTPIILLTAKGKTDDRVEGLEIGADDYLAKPFEPKELTLRIQNILNKTKKNNQKRIVEFDNIKITSVPTRHFTGRGIFDRFKSLWTGYVIELDSIKVYFSGDTGYNQGFKLAQKKFGDFDLAFLEAGAYNENWNKVHMLPPETIQAAKDLKTKFIVPIHNGTFDLAFHPWFDPLEQAVFFANKAGIPILTPIFGQKVIIDHQLLELSQNEKSKWWKPLLPKEYLFKPWSTPNSK